MLIIDGVGDDPLPELGGRTPLDAADTPCMDYLASNGEAGEVETAFEGYPVESLVCIMGLLGYDPVKYYPCGRATFEAMARGISLGENDLALRCNIVKAAKGRGSIVDFTAGMISGASAEKILSGIKLPASTWELYPGQSYRNLLVIRQAPVKAGEIKFFEPHMHHNEPLENILPSAATEQAEPLARALKNFTLDSYAQIASMGMGKDCEDDMLWLWSASSKPRLPSFESLYGLTGAVVAGLDFMHGLALAAGMYFEPIPGATGYIDTNYAAKAEAAIRTLGEYDFVLTHVNAADEAAHARDPAQKTAAIESADRYILKPVFSYLEEHFHEKFVIIVCGDHKTRCSDGKHTGDPAPFVLYRARRQYKANLPSSRVPSLQFMKKAFGLL